MRIILFVFLFCSLSQALTLHQKQATFAHLLPSLIQKAESLGYEVTLGEAWRPEALAFVRPKKPVFTKWYADHGKGIADSLHIQRLAIDLNLFKNGKYLTEVSDYEALGSWWEKQSTKEYTLAWGGRFKKLKDAVHFSMENEGRQ